jgi:hypothetical protein
MSNLFDVGFPILVLVAAIVGPIALQWRVRAVARRHFQYELMYRGPWLPWFIPFVGFGAVRRRSVYGGACRTCGLKTPPEGASLVAIARHARAHERAGVHSA